MYLYMYICVCLFLQMWVLAHEQLSVFIHRDALYRAHMKHTALDEVHIFIDICQGRLSGLVDSEFDHTSLPPEIKSMRCYI